MNWLRMNKQMNENLWPPIVMCIVILLVLGFCSPGHTYCRVGEDGNIYTDQTPEEMFVDPANHDFHLKEGSCAIAMGATIPEVMHDFDGNLRPPGQYDVGAYQFVPSRPNAPEGLQLTRED